MQRSSPAQVFASQKFVRVNQLSYARAPLLYTTDTVCDILLQGETLQDIMEGYACQKRGQIVRGGRDLSPI